MFVIESIKILNHMLKYVFMIQFLDTINCGAVGAKGDNCSDNATCTDGNGSYMCECKDGFTGDGFTCTGKWITEVLNIC